MPNNPMPAGCWLRLYPVNSGAAWQKTELHHITPVVPAEAFCEVNEHLDPDIVQAFSTPRPQPDSFLLHYGPGWDSNPEKTPVLLIHGAGLDANSFVNLYGLGVRGLQPQLTSLGYRVFALTFSHGHGDNFNQAEQLAAAIKHIKELAQVEKINLVAHSKGGTAARIYLSGLSRTPYRGDVDRYIMLGTPNLGLDYAFRHPHRSYLLYLSGGNGVIPWDQLTVMGFTVDTRAYAIYSDGCFPGQSQLLYRWDQIYPLDASQPDWYTTYYGGTGFFSRSRGIDAAIAGGHNLVQRLNRRGIEPGVRLFILAGSNNFFGSIPGESTGPSDGVVLLDSVLYSDGLTLRGAHLELKEELHLNHLELLFSFQAARWVHRQLQS